MFASLHQEIGAVESVGVGALEKKFDEEPFDYVIESDSLPRFGTF